MPRAERKAQLVQVAEEIFSQQGYAGTTMEAVAEAAGITKPVIYDLFGSKEGLLAACLGKARAELLGALRNAWRSAPTGTGLQGMHRAGLVAFFDFMDGHAAVWRAIVEDQSVYNGGPISEVRVAQSELVVVALRQHPELVDVPPVLVEGAVQAIIGACERVAAWRLGHPEVSAEAAAELVSALTWGGLNNLGTLPLAVADRPGAGSTLGLVAGL